MQRRTFVKGIAATSLMSLTATTLKAKPRQKKREKSNILTGNEFFLDICQVSPRCSSLLIA